MLFSKFKLFGLLAALTIPFAAQVSVETAIAQSQGSATQSLVAQQSTGVNVEALLEEIAELQKRPCDVYNRTVTEGVNVYNICGSSRVDRTQSLVPLVAASQSSKVDDASVLYTYNYNAKVVAITYFSGDRVQTFAFDRRGKLQAELTNSSSSLRTTFTKEERDRLEKLAKEGGANILSKFL